MDPLGANVNETLHPMQPSMSVTSGCQGCVAHDNSRLQRTVNGTLFTPTLF